MKSRKLLLFYLLLMAAFSGCMVGKKYTKPPAPVGIDFRNATHTDTVMPARWFDIYHDTALQHLIKTTLDSNRDLLAAAQHIQEARAIVGQVKSYLFPSLNYQAQAGGGSAGTEAIKVNSGLNSAVFSAFGVLNWEIDIWGKLKRSSHAATDEMLASTAFTNALQVSLIAEVASDYFLLRDLDNRLLIAKSTLESRKENTRINTDRFAKGYVAELDKLWSIQQEATAAATIPGFERQINETENALRLLIGMGPGKIPRGSSNFEQSLSPDIPVGLPSQLLERRPDIIEQEYVLQAQFEQIGISQAALFPSVSLTGLLGFASPQLSTLFSSQGFVANGFGSLFGPIFNFNRNRLQIDIAVSRTQQLYYQYQQTVLKAFSEVDNALAAYRGFNEENLQRRIQVASASRALALSQARYDNGFTSYLEVLTQQNILFDAQLLESISLQAKLNSIVALYKALGGGWNMPK